MSDAATGNVRRPTVVSRNGGTSIHTYSFITSCQTQPYMRAEIAQPTAKTIVTQLELVGLRGKLVGIFIKQTD